MWPDRPPSGPFCFFLVMICASSKWSQVSLVSTQNLVFSRILAHILKLKAQCLDHPIRILRVDNAGKFTSPTFDNFCMSAGINVQYSVAHVHFQKGIAKSLIKPLQMIARSLLMTTNLPASGWGHANTHANALVRYRPSAFNTQTPHHLAFGTTPDVTHLQTFGCQVLVPILGPKRKKMGPQHQHGIHVGFDSNSIIRYLESTTADVLKARFTGRHFYENIFPQLQVIQNERDITADKLQWQIQSGFWNNPRTTQVDT